MLGGLGTYSLGTAPLGTSEEEEEGSGALYAMRARDPGDTVYVHWVVSGYVDTMGVEAPSSVDVATIIVVAAWGLPHNTFTLVQTFSGAQNVAAPAAITDLGSGYLLVLVDTADVGWSALDVLTLPAAPQTGFRVLVKDSTGSAGSKPIVVDGNGNAIDGDSTHTIGISYAAVDLVFNGVSWVVY